MPKKNPLHVSYCKKHFSIRKSNYLYSNKNDKIKGKGNKIGMEKRARENRTTNPLIEVRELQEYGTEEKQRR